MAGAEAQDDVGGASDGVESGLLDEADALGQALLDEPEAHLHPPLLASCIRALSDLLTDRNGVALIGTHSPVVLQEVPRSCVWKVSRIDRRASERLAIETYGENVGILTREAFNLEAGNPVSSNVHDLWIGLGLDAKGVPSRVIDFWSSSGPTLHHRPGRYARAERSECRWTDRDRLPDRRRRPRGREADAGRRPGG
ncbi:hypothetical protein [Streptomyces sp. NPDC002671]